jgi:hypothetical protein
VRVEPALGHKFNGDERGGYWPYGAAATSATENVGPATHGNPDKPPFQVCAYAVYCDDTTNSIVHTATTLTSVV